MIDDENIRVRLEAAGIRSNPRPATRGIQGKSARRGTPEFEDLMAEMEEEWDLDEEELENIAEIRRAGDSFEFRIKGSDEWELLEDEEEDDGDGPPGRGEDFGGEEE
jgi:hypothetical protein